ncbi:hypothetical protein ACFP6B_02590, partial [Rothia nasimurium]
SKVNESWADVILQGPFFSVANPFAKQPNASMKNNLDYTEIDLEALPADFIPRTSYQPVGSTADNGDYDKSYTQWTDPVTGEKYSARSVMRLGWRRMAALTGVRTVYPTVIPAGAAHVHAVIATGGIKNELQSLGYIGGYLSSLVSDFFARVSGVSDLFGSVIDNFPLSDNKIIRYEVAQRFTELTCLTAQMSELWEGVHKNPWTIKSPVRKERDRLIVQSEIDALVAISFRITPDELITIYNTQFSVLQQYDGSNLFDHNGRKLPKEISKLVKDSAKNGTTLPLASLRWTHPQSQREYVFEEPFTTFDREQALRDAYEKFSYLASEN